MTPLELKNSLDEMVIGQDNAKKALSVAFCEHFHHARRCIEEPDRSSKMWHKKIFYWSARREQEKHNYAERWRASSTRRT